MEILSQAGAILFVFMWAVGLLLNIFQPKWYWEKFIPKLHKNEEKHPVITGIALLLLVIIMLLGCIRAVKL